MSLISPAVYKEHDPGATLGDDALQRLIDANEAYMVRILGPHTREGSPAVDLFDGGLQTILPRQAVGSVVQVRERPYSDATWTVLASDDYLVLDDGLTLRRVETGTNPSTRWAYLTEVTYVPMSNLAERIAALLDMVGTDVGTGVATPGGLVRRTMGSWTEEYGDGDSGGTSVDAAKNRILARLLPRAGVVLA